MKILFHTKNLDKTFYRQIILQYILDHLITSGSIHGYGKFKNDWTIRIYPVEDWDGNLRGGTSVGTTNPGIPHGVTGEGIVKVYVIDSADKGLMALQNFAPILHEVAHMILIMIMRGQRGIYRNNDLSGNKKGMDGNISTQEVHDRQMEGNFYQVKAHVNVGTWWKRKWQPYTAIGINLKDFLKTNT